MPASAWLQLRAPRWGRWTQSSEMTSPSCPAGSEKPAHIPLLSQEEYMHNQVGLVNIRGRLNVPCLLQDACAYSTAV